MEHLLNPSQQLMDFHQRLAPSGKIIFKWYFFKGFNQEFPFHLEDQEEINTFFINFSLILARFYTLIKSRVVATAN